MSLAWWRYPTRRFTIDGLDFAVRTVARLDGVHATLTMLGVEVAHDHVPMGGPEATRNFDLGAALPDGRRLHVDAGYIGWWAIGIVVRLDGRIVHESHPGKTPQFPESLKDHVATDWKTQGVFAPRNRIPFAIDIATGLLFFAVAKLTDLTTAALVGAAVGIALVAFQRITRIDVTGGLAIFGIVMLCLSAAIAFFAADESWVQMRSTIVGCVAATCFLGDVLIFKGRRLAAALARYMPYDDLDLRRLGVGIGTVGLLMALLNLVVVRVASKDVWLYYTTFGDVVITMVLFVQVLKYARPGAAAARGAA